MKRAERIVGRSRARLWKDETGIFSESLRPEFRPDGAASLSLWLLSRRSALLFVLPPSQTCARFHGRSPTRLSFSLSTPLT